MTAKPSLRDQLLAAWAAEDAEPLRPISINGWPTIYVRPLTVAEADAQQKDDPNGGWKNDLKMTVGAAVVICDEKGNRLFDPNNEEDVKRIGSRAFPKILKALEAVRAAEEDATGK